MVVSTIYEVLDLSNRPRHMALFFLLCHPATRCHDHCCYYFRWQGIYRLSPANHAVPSEHCSPLSVSQCGNCRGDEGTCTRIYHVWYQLELSLLPVLPAVLLDFWCRIAFLFDVLVQMAFLTHAANRYQCTTNVRWLQGNQKLSISPRVLSKALSLSLALSFTC